ncbi:MAG: hypothetical protein K2X66_12335 [Cyanobacteria bacterium]|nr:hypothetical protein [Cyanobacteriota bacterium]
MFIFSIRSHFISPKTIPFLRITSCALTLMIAGSFLPETYSVTWAASAPHAHQKSKNPNTKKQVLPSPEAQRQVMQKKINGLVSTLGEVRTRWYESARDIAFLQQIVAEAQLTLEIDVANQGTRLIFIEEYGPALSQNVLQALVQRPSEALKGIHYQEPEVSLIRDRGHQLILTEEQHQEEAKGQMKKLLDEIETLSLKLEGKSPSSPLTSPLQLKTKLQQPQPAK